MASVGRPRIANPSKDAKWKRAQRSGTRGTKCANCGRTTGLIQHHRDGVMNNEGNRQTLCRRCHTLGKLNPMKRAIAKRAK